MGDWISRAAIQRVLEGVRRRGPIDLTTDSRCFLRESIEELLDTLNYARWGYEKRQLSKKDWQRVDEITRHIIAIIERSCPGFKFCEKE